MQKLLIISIPVIGGCSSDRSNRIGGGAAAGDYLYDRHRKTKEKACEAGYKEGQKEAEKKSE